MESTPQLQDSLVEYKEKLVLDVAKFKQSNEKDEVTFVSVAHIEQPAALKKFFKDKLSDPFNKYCIDCKKNQTTHAVIWIGAFVCGECAQQHKSRGGNFNSYIKDIYKEHWDDYQLRSICLGGNKALFDLMKDYKIESQPLATKYKHACIQWYKKRHLALMDGSHFDSPMPPKDWDERY